MSPSIYDLFDKKPAPVAATEPIDGSGELSGYARRALDSEAGRVAVAAERTRNDTLNRAAFALGQLVAGGVLPEHLVRERLTMAAARAGLDARETEATITSGLTAGAGEPRTAPPRDNHTTTLDGGDVRRTLAGRMLSGGAFVLDTPARVPAVWGTGADVLWSEGEALILAGPPGVGKTTLTGQLVRGLLGLQGEVLGYAIVPAAHRVLYLAMDRPRQIARSLARHFTSDERDVLDERLVVWPGPPPADLARLPELLADLAREAGASHIVLDSLKDAAVGLTEDEVGAMYNRARQTALAAGVEVLELHHVVKRGPNGARPSTLADLYGSTWITAGAGSVVLLWGAAGDPIVDLHHLKQPAEPVGPLRVIHDHEHGISQVWQSTDPLVVLRLAGEAGVSAQRLAAAMFETDKPDRNQIEKARRRLARLATDGLAEAVEGPPPVGGGKPQTAYRAITQPITHVIEGGAITDDTSNHAEDETAGQTITQPITAITQGSNHDPHHPFKGVGSVAVPGTTENHSGTTGVEPSNPHPDHADFQRFMAELGEAKS